MVEGYKEAHGVLQTLQNVGGELLSSYGIL